MTFRMTFAVLALALVPGLAQAQCAKGHQEASMTCAEGTSWNAETRTCVVSTS